MRRFLTLCLTIVLVVAACGSDGDDQPGDADSAAASDQDPDGTAMPAEPDPDSQAGGDIDQAPQPGDGVPFTQVLDSGIAGPVTIEGMLVIAGGEARLCEALAESFPPQCGGRSAPISGVDTATIPQLVTEGDVSWTDSAWTVVAELGGDAGSFIVVQQVD